jgi:perosamine synthetase
MKPGSNSFVIPREPWLSWRHLRVKASLSPQVRADFQPEPEFFFWARNALFHALYALQVPRTARALLPAYLCKAAVEPFEAYGLQIDFYRIGRDCKADLGDLAAKVQPNTRVVLAAHYFGFPQDIVEISNFCTARRLLLFEDCAHVLRGSAAGQHLGSFGDASVFSYRKFLPMFDGAQLLLRDLKAALPIASRQASRFARTAARHILGQAVERASGFGIRLLRGLIELARKPSQGSDSSTAGRVRQQPAVDNNSASFDRSVVDQPITPASRWVLRHSDVSAVIARRRENFRLLQSQLENTTGITPLFGSLAEGVCPWVYPLFLDNIPDAHLLLRAKGVPAVTWGGVRPGGISPSEFPDANFLYDNLVFLPVHQDLTPHQLSAVADVVKQVRVEFRQLVAERIPVAS